MTAATNPLDLQKLYRDVILDHARAPRNFRRLELATHAAEGINPLCGDKLHLYLSVDADETVVDVSFEGSGCAISMASASLLTETIANQPVAIAANCGDSFIQNLAGEPDCSDTPEILNHSTLRALEGVREHPSRIKCATLAWQTMLAALRQQSVATTE